MGLFSRKPAGKAKDPVCGMLVDPAKAAGRETHDGTTFYFCSNTCWDTFRNDSHRYGH
jgi:Cu+-exporting ATPase